MLIIIDTRPARREDEEEGSSGRTLKPREQDDQRASGDGHGGSENDGWRAGVNKSPYNILAKIAICRRGGFLPCMVVNFRIRTFRRRPGP